MWVVWLAMAAVIALYWFQAEHIALDALPAGFATIGALGLAGQMSIPFLPASAVRAFSGSSSGSDSSSSSDSSWSSSSSPLEVIPVAAATPAVAGDSGGGGSSGRASDNCLYAPEHGLTAQNASSTFPNPGASLLSS